MRMPSVVRRRACWPRRRQVDALVEEHQGASGSRSSDVAIGELPLLSLSA
jgi:hypothetical protein